MLSKQEISKLKETVYETPDGGSYIPAITGLPYKVETPYFDRKDLPKMDANNVIDISPATITPVAAEILVPKELQARLNENALEQALTQASIENAELRKDLLLKLRYIIIYEFMLATGIDGRVYDKVDDLQKGLKFVLKEKPNDSPPSN